MELRALALFVHGALPRSSSRRRLLPRYAVRSAVRLLVSCTTLHKSQINHLTKSIRLSFTKSVILIKMTSEEMLVSKRKHRLVAKKCLHENRGKKAGRRTGDAAEDTRMRRRVTPHVRHMMRNCQRCQTSFWRQRICGVHDHEPLLTPQISRL